jgi:glycosyltransferase XagB
MQARPQRLGEILRAHGHLNDAQLGHALGIQARSQGRLGDILVSEGIIGYLPLYRAVAEHHDLPFADLLSEQPHPDLLQHSDCNLYLDRRFIPWKKEGAYLHIALSDFTPEMRELLHAKYGPHLLFSVTSPFDIRRTVERVFGGIFEEEACNHLWRQRPIASARERLSATLRPPAYLIGAVLALCLLLHPLGSILWVVGLCTISYCVSMLIKSLIFKVGKPPEPATDWAARIARLDNITLPVYTVLVPMYREASSLPHLMAAMRRMDYPKHKLDIKLILEADDTDTLSAAQALRPHYLFDIICVPPSTLRTKPKAMNFALRFARGDFVTVYDADDQPDPLQLKKALCHFYEGDSKLVCVQARLGYFNTADNWLTRCFSLEYAMLFHVLLVGLERMSIPLPLGGTSNHFPTAKLREMGGWDPYNVTEDADLGTRIASLGYHTCMLDSITLEEAPNRLGAWIRQRSRWMKGYMQTWLVHMREPRSLYRTLGPRSFWGFQFFVGFSTFTFLTAPLIWAVALIWVFYPNALLPEALPGWVKWLTMVNIALNVLSHWWMTLSCLHIPQAPRRGMVFAALTYPAYVLIHSIASYMALWQLIVKPHFWEKTTHGVAFSPELSNLHSFEPAIAKENH